MIGIILERFFIILNNSIKTNENIDNNKEKSAKNFEFSNSNVTIEVNRLSEDAKVILPAIKVIHKRKILYFLEIPKLIKYNS